jgi:hypothetical protein
VGLSFAKTRGASKCGIPFPKPGNTQLCLMGTSLHPLAIWALGQALSAHPSIPLAWNDIILRLSRSVPFLGRGGGGTHAPPPLPSPCMAQETSIRAVPALQTGTHGTELWPAPKCPVPVPLEKRRG